MYDLSVRNSTVQLPNGTFIVVGKFSIERPDRVFNFVKGDVVDDEGNLVRCSCCELLDLENWYALRNIIPADSHTDIIDVHGGCGGEIISSIDNKGVSIEQIKEYLEVCKAIFHATDGGYVHHYNATKIWFFLPNSDEQ